MRAEEDRRLEELRRKTYENTYSANQSSYVPAQDRYSVIQSKYTTTNQDNFSANKSKYDNIELERQRAREEIAQIRNNRIGEYEKGL